MPRGRPKGSKNRTPEEKQATRSAVEKAMAQNDAITGRVDPLTLSKSVALYNAEHTDQHITIYEVPFPENWDKMGKVEKLKWLTEHRK